MSDPKDVRGAPVQTALRTMETLELVAEAAEGLTVLQLAAALGADKSVASRMLSSLVSSGYVTRDPVSDRHSLSLKLFGLALRNTGRTGFPVVCEPSLQRLSEELGELVQLSAVDDDHLVLVSHSQAKHRLSVMPMPGRSYPPHATSSGKAWLASMTNERALAIALRNGLVALTEKTITTLDGLLAELDRVREAGFATHDGEAAEGIRAVACAIGQERFGAVVGTVAVSAPSSRVSPEQMAELAPAVERCAREIEAVWPADAARLVERAG